MSSLALLLAAALAPAQASDSMSHIIGGDRTDDFEAVGTIAAYSERYGVFGFCSGTLVREDWVVTAAHCIEGADEYLRYGMDIIFVVGTSITVSSGIDDYAYVEEMYEHPEYRLPRYDTGLLKLSDGGLPDVPTIPLNTDAPSSSWRGQDITYVGWGNTNNYGGGSGTKRTVDVPVLDYDAHVIYTHDSTGETNICSGDSGGAALYPDPSTGELELVGVNSFGFMLDYSREVLCESPEAAAGVSRVDASYDWFIEIMGPPPVEEEPEVTDEESTDTGADADDDLSIGDADASEDVDGSEGKGGCSTASSAGGLGWAALSLSLLGLVRRRGGEQL